MVFCRWGTRLESQLPAKSILNRSDRKQHAPLDMPCWCVLTCRRPFVAYVAGSCHITPRDRCFPFVRSRKQRSYSTVTCWSFLCWSRRLQVRGHRRDRHDRTESARKDRWQIVWERGTWPINNSRDGSELMLCSLFWRHTITVRVTSMEAFTRLLRS